MKRWTLLWAILGGLSVGFMAGCGGGGSKALSREQADKLVREQILPGEQLPDGSDWVVTRLPEPLPAGAVISAPADETQTPPSMTLDEPSFLYVLDRDPATLFSRELELVVVGQSGARRTLKVQAPPTVDRVEQGALIESPSAVDLLLDGSTEFGAVQSVAPGFIIPQLEVAPVEEQIIVVNGSSKQEGSAQDPAYQAWQSYRAMQLFWSAYTPRQPGSDLLSLENPDANAVLNAIDAAVAAGKKTITVVLISPVALPGVVKLPAGSLGLVQVMDKVTANSNVNFAFVLAFYQANFWASALSTRANVRAVLTTHDVVGNIYMDVDCYNNVVDFDPTDQGLEFLSAWLAAASAYTASSAAFSKVTHAVGAGDAPSTALVCLAGHGALGERPEDGLGQDLDLMHRAHKVTWVLHCPVLPSTP